MDVSSLVTSRSAEGSVAREAVLQRIGVRPPYYALRSERLVGDRFVAEASAGLDQGPALGPMRPGDLSRHGAISGLCALAARQRDENRRYYLARDAVFRGFPVEGRYGAPVRFEATVLDLDKRQGRTRVEAFLDERLVAELEVGYTVLTDAAFRRLNRARQRPNPELDTMAVLPNAPFRREGERVWRDLTIPVEVCSGHFEQHPAGPVAILMDQLAQLGEVFPEGRSYIRFGRVTASDLCWAGETARFEMIRREHDGASHRFDGSIVRGGVVIGTMDLDLCEAPAASAATGTGAGGREATAAD